MKGNANTVILFLIVFVDMMGFSIIFPLFPETIKYYMQIPEDFLFSRIYSKLHLLNENFNYIVVLFGGILGGVYSLLQFFFSPIWGKLSDIYGRKRILLITTFGNFLGYLLWLFSYNFSIFILSRVITGAMGGNISVASAAMADATSREDRAKGMGMIGAGIGLGFIIGPTLGGVLSKFNLWDFLPWLSSFGIPIFSFSAFVSVIISLLNFFLVLFFLKNTSTLYEKQKQPIHPFLGIFHNNYRELLAISFIYFGFVYSFSGFEFSLNFFLNEFLEFTPQGIGFTFFYLGIIIVLVQGGLLRKLSGKVPEEKIALWGFIFLILGYMGLSSVVFYSKPWLLFSSLGLLAVGSALMNPALSSIASLRSKSDEQGKNLGIFRSFGSLGRALSPFSFAWIYFQYTEVAPFVTSLFITVLLGFWFLVFFRGRLFGLVS